MDPTGTPLNQITLHGTLHGIFGAIVFSLMPITCFVYLRRFSEDSEWQSFQGWTLGAGIIISAAVLLMTIAIKLPGTLPILDEWIGLIQRAAIVPFMIWLLVLA